MADYMQKYADKQVEQLGRKIDKTYRQAAREIKQKMQSFWDSHKAISEKMLKDVKDGKITEQDYKDWLRNQVFTGDRWKAKLDEVTKAYREADEKARKLVGDTDKDIFAHAANWQARDTSKAVNGAVSFDMYDRKTVDRLLRDDPKMLPEWKINQKKDYIWNEKRVRNAVTQGIIQGESVYDIGKRLTGELAASNASKMDMFARTAVTGAQNAGRIERLHEAEAMGIKVKKKWLSAHDNRVRDAHADLDGMEVDVDEPFHNELGDIMYPGDPTADPGNIYNCRCTLIYVYPEYQASGKKEIEEEAGQQAVEEQKEATEKPFEQYPFKQEQMSEDDYTDWQSVHATSKQIEADFEKQYGVSLEDALMGRGDRYIEEKGEWLYDIAQNALADVDQVQSGHGKCGYIQAADGSKAINAYLRKGEVGKVYTKKQMEETIASMDRLIESTTLDRDLVVDRCAGIDALEHMGIDIGTHGKSFHIGHAFCTEDLNVQSIVDKINSGYIGSELVDKGLMSASVSPGLNVFGGSDVTFTILAPKGTHAFISDNVREAEVVFGSGTTQKIVGARASERMAKDHDGKEIKREIVEIFLEII